MGRYLCLAGLFLAVAMLQTSRYLPLSPGAVRPDFFLLLVIYLNLFVYDVADAWSGFAAGLLEDLLSGGAFGAAMFSKTLSGYGVSLLGNMVVLDNPLVQALLVFVVGLAEGGVRFLLLDFLGIVHLELGAAFSLIFSQSLLTTLLALPFFWLLRRGQRFWAPES